MLRVAAWGLCSSTLVSAFAASAQMGAPSLAASAPTSAVPAAAAVSTFYDTWQSQPIWFRGGVPSTAVGQLVSILRRAPFDSFETGPQLATQVQAAVAQAASGKPDDIAAAERTLSTAWVQYVQAIKRPTPGMEWEVSSSSSASNFSRWREVRMA